MIIDLVDDSVEILDSPAEKPVTVKPKNDQDISQMEVATTVQVSANQNSSNSLCHTDDGENSVHRGSETLPCNASPANRPESPVGALESEASVAERSKSSDMQPFESPKTADVPVEPNKPVENTEKEPVSCDALDKPDSTRSIIEPNNPISGNRISVITSIIPTNSSQHLPVQARDRHKILDSGFWVGFWVWPWLSEPNKNQNIFGFWLGRKSLG